MIHRLRLIWIVIAVALAASVPVLASPADQVRTRIANLKQLGTAYKTMNDALRANDVLKIRQAANNIGGAAQAIYGWFPAGSGPQPGVKTAARPEIWSRTRDFRMALDAFSRQAQSLQRAAATGNIDLIRSESRRLGATCKGCHDNFRTSED